MALVALAIALAWLLLSPEPAWAWGPTTHAFLSSRILGDLALLPPVVRDLLQAHPYPFIYGSLSADITLAKKYVHYSRHCHNWTVGYEILDRAETPPLQSFALGYLSHLAADTIAHNVFVPRQLLATPLTSNFGHTYWEYRFDAAVGEDHLRLAREVVTMDHAEPDALLESVLTQALFSFQTNKRIFQQLIHLSNRERWQALWSRMSEESRWELSVPVVERFSALALGYVVDFLRSGAESLSQELDPTGHERLTLAKRLRRQSFREARREAGRDLATGGLSTVRFEDAARVLAARPVSQAEMELLAAVFFPEPVWPEPAVSSDDRALPDRRDDRAFWSAFGGARALPAPG